MDRPGMIIMASAFRGGRVLYVFLFFPPAFYRANPERMPSLFFVFFPAFYRTRTLRECLLSFCFFFLRFIARTLRECLLSAPSSLSYFFCFLPANPERMPSVCPQQPENTITL